MLLGGLLAVLPARAEFDRYLLLSSPQILSVGLAWTMGSPEEEGFRPVLEADVGIGGGRLALGMDSLGDGFGAGIKAAYIQTWFEPVDADPNQSYLGLELEAGLDRLFGRLGFLRRVEGDGDGWLTTFGLGFRM